jgi:hypothetical protein
MPSSPLARALRHIPVFAAAQTLHRLLTRARPAPKDYAAWFRRHGRLSTRDKRAIDQHIARLKNAPRFSIVFCAKNTPAKNLELTIASVLAQLYGNWELLIPMAPEQMLALSELVGRYAGDSRIKLRWDRVGATISLA